MKNNIKVLFQTSFIVAVFFLLSSIPSYSAPPKPFAPVNAKYVVTQPDPDLTAEVLTTKLDGDLIASSSSSNLGSLLKPWGNIYGMFGRFAEVISNTISATGTNQSLSLNPTGTGRVLVGGDSIVVAAKSSEPTDPVSGQIYFDTVTNNFRGYNGTNWVNLSEAIPTFPMSGLISYWKLDEGSDGSGAVTRVDSHGLNNLTDNNTTASATGKISNGADFEISNGEYLSIADSSQSGLDLSTDFSISFWLKLESFSSSAAVVAKDSSGSRGYNIALQAADGRILVEFWNGNTNPDNLSFFKSDAGVVTTGSWQHYVVVVDVSVPSAQIYKNGTAINTNAVNTNAATLQNSSGDFAIGRQGSFDPAYLDGVVDEVGVWNRILTGSEVETLYNSGDGLTL